MNVDITSKMDLFEYTGTKPEEWKLCEIITCTIDDWGNVLFPKFKVDPSYTFAPDYDRIKSKWENLHEDDKRCRICGQKLVHCFVVKHDEKKLVTIIGRECAKKYPFLNFEVQLKEMLEKKYQPVFSSWESYAEKCIRSDERFHNVKNNGNLKQMARVQRLQEQPRKLYTMLINIKNKKPGYKKMRKILLIADELRIKIPYVLHPLFKKKIVGPIVSLDSYFA